MLQREGLSCATDVRNVLIGVAQQVSSYGRLYQLEGVDHCCFAFSAGPDILSRAQYMTLSYTSEALSVSLYSPHHKV